MQAIEPTRLSEILDEHEKTIFHGNGKPAVFENVNLNNMNFTGRNLTLAKFINTSLRYTNFIDTTLDYATFDKTDLYNTLFINATFKHASLRNVNLTNANLRNTNFSHCSLYNSTLTNVNLQGTIGNMQQIKSFQIEKYPIAYTAELIQIGHECHTIDKWNNYSDAIIATMDYDALKWWQKWRSTLFKIIEISPCV